VTPCLWVTGSRRFERISIPYAADEGATNLRNVWNHSSNDTASNLQTHFCNHEVTFLGGGGGRRAFTRTVKSGRLNLDVSELSSCSPLDK
jgi:hypothetical protein